ncbi:hypothetical protein O3P69_012259 [Scylla paramamosain]|uniref:Uncharacterized protein n=1 Tax=Scylla paramamosain TaxID=85552 RepID=A0AAW0TCA3_SCYPA
MTLIIVMTLYHQPRRVLKERMTLERNAAAAEVEGQVIYSEGEEIDGFVPSLRCSADGEDEGWVTVEVPSMHRSFPGFILQQRDIPTLEEATYKFPPSAGIAEEEVEEVQEYEDYWKIKDMVFQPSRYTEEAKKYIDAKLQYTEDYFERLESGNLTPAELSETRPDNFDDPFYPTPQQLEFLNNLNITVDWPLSELHLHHLTTYTLSSKTYAEWHSMGILVESSRFTLREDKILARNWFAFQKEYGFYDLRPLVSARTGRVLRECGRVMVQPFEYLSQRNKVHFLLYLGKDLPHRTLNLIYRKARKLLPFLRGRCLMRKAQRMTGLMLAKLQYVMEIFGTDMLAAELLIGPPLSSFFSVCFLNHFMLRNIKLRIGPWKKAEDQRMLQGLKQVMKVQSFEMAYHLRKIPWMQIFPYVRTRNPTYMRRRMNILAGRSGEKYSVSVMRQEMVKFIRLLYSKQVDNFHGLDWEGLAREMDSANPIRLSWSFRKLYFNHIPYKHRITVPEGLQYMYDVFIPYYENLTQANDAEFQGTHHLNPEHPDLGNPDDPDPGNPDDPDPGNPDDPDEPDLSIGPGERSEVRNSICGLIPGNCGLGDLSGVDGERQGCITHSRGDGSGDSDLRSRDEVRREQSDLRNSRKVSDSNLSDLSTELNNHNSKKVKDHYPDDPRNRRKVTKQQSDLQNSRRKGRRNHQDDLTRPLRMTRDDLTQLGKPPLQELHDLTCIPPQCDLGTLNVDLSDSDDDLAWGNDGLEFEEVTLGQALGRDVECVKGSR